MEAFLKQTILAFSVDGEFFSYNPEKSVFFGEDISIYFSNNLSLKITTDDIPHFYGEGDLILKYGDSGGIDKTLPSLNFGEITEIKSYYWKTKGLSFGSDKYFVQIEFFNRAKLMLSIGFFYFELETNKMECLITGELAVNTTHQLSVSDFAENLSVVEIN